MGVDTRWGAVGVVAGLVGGVGKVLGGFYLRRWSGDIWSPELWGLQGCGQTSVPTASPWTS